MRFRSAQQRYADEHREEFKSYLAIEASRFFSGTSQTLSILLLAAMVWNYFMAGQWAGAFWILPVLYMQLASSVAPFLSQQSKWSDLRRYLPDGMVLLVLLSTAFLNYSLWKQGRFSANAPMIVATLICTPITFHRLKGTIIRNSIFFVVISLFSFLLAVDDPHWKDYTVQALLGIFTGTGCSRFFTVILEYRFFEHSTGQKIQRHLVGELAKLAFPHQIDAIQAGDALETTMPVEVSRSTVLVFDVQNSSSISSSSFKKMLDRAISSCNAYIMSTYTAGRECVAYKLNEAYDGFICSIGFPFEIPKDLRHKDADMVAVELAFRFIEIFDEIVETDFKDEKVFCAIGIAKGEIEGYYPHSGPKVYGMRGRSIILASRYEGYRKVLLPDMPLSSHIILLQTSVWSNLSSSMKEKFIRSELPAKAPVRNAHDEKDIHYFLSEPSEQKKIDEAAKKYEANPETGEAKVVRLVDEKSTKKSS